MARTAWQLQEAKNKLSEVIDRAQKSGPQTVTRHGRAAAVILSADDYRKMTGGRKGLVAFFRSSPLVGEELDVRRSDDRGREINL